MHKNGFCSSQIAITSRQLDSRKRAKRRHAVIDGQNAYKMLVASGEALEQRDDARRRVDTRATLSVEQRVANLAIRAAVGVDRINATDRRRHVSERRCRQLVEVACEFRLVIIHIDN